MSAKQFEERLLAELKDYVNERPATSTARPQGRRARAERARRSTWRLASGGLSVAAAIALVVVLTDGGAPAGSAASKLPAVGSAVAPDPATYDSLYHVQDAGFAIDDEPGSVVDITILQGDAKPDVAAIRVDVAKAGIPARVVQVPTCTQLVASPGAPSPVGSAQAVSVTDPKDHFFWDSSGHLVFQVDASAAADRDTTVWLVVADTLSTLLTERLADTSPQPNCL
jgi:hypothetical protein